MMSLFNNKSAEQYYLQGTTHAINGNFDKAIKLLSKAIEKKDGYQEAYLHRANAYINIGEDALAISDLNYCIEQNPNNGITFYNRSIAYMGLGKKDQALSDIDQAIQLSRDEPGYYNHRCIIRSFMGDFDLAIADAEKVIELGNDQTGHNNKAIILEKQGEFSAAIEEWTILLESNPGSANYLCRRGILFEKTGMKKDAFDDLKRGLKKKKQLLPSLRKTAEEVFHTLESTFHIQG